MMVACISTRCRVTSTLGVVLFCGVCIDGRIHDADRSNVRHISTGASTAMAGAITYYWVTTY